MLEQNFKDKGGEFREFRIGDLFELCPFKKLNLQKSILPKEPCIGYNLPAITCTSLNNGISCFVPRQNATIFKNCISVAANGDAPCFYQANEFTILQDAYVLKFKNKELNQKAYLYLTSLLQKTLLKYDWSNKSGWNKVKDDIISLPIYANGQIAFDFMEDFIAQLEIERVKEIKLEHLRDLEAYLKATGLKDYHLSQSEKTALNAFLNSQANNTNGGGGIKYLLAA